MSKHDVVITVGPSGLPHHHSDLRGWTATKVTPVSRTKREPWKANNGKVRAFIDTPTFKGTDLAFNTRDQVLSFIRLACDHTYEIDRIYGGGFDGKGEFLIVAAQAKNGWNKTKLIIEPCEGTEEEAA